MQPIQDSSSARQLQILKLYLKDASFELPMGAALFGLNAQPAMKVDMDHNATQINAEQYEAVLRVSVTAQIEGKTAFMVEVHQAGLFLVKGLNTMELDAVTNAFFPNSLFPYAREAVSDLVGKEVIIPAVMPCGNCPICDDSRGNRCLAQKPTA